MFINAEVSDAAMQLGLARSLKSTGLVIHSPPSTFPVTLFPPFAHLHSYLACPRRSPGSYTGDNYTAHLLKRLQVLRILHWADFYIHPHRHRQPCNSPSSLTTLTTNILPGVQVPQDL